jgi:hypothetical protein
MSYLWLPFDSTEFSFPDIVTVVPGVIMYFGDNGNTSDIVIPVAELWVFNYSQVADFLQTTTFVIVTLTSTEPNLWKVTYDSAWTYVLQMSLEAFSLACLLLAIVRWAQFYEFNGGFRVNIPQVSFALTIASALIRIVGDLDPQGMRQLFNRLANGLLGSLPLQFAVTPYFLLCLYWNEILMQQSLRVNVFLRKLKIPFFVITGVFFGVSTLLVILRVMDLGIEVQTIYAYLAVTSAFLLALVIFYLVTTIRILKKLAESEKLSQRKRQTRRSAIFLIMGCIGIFVDVVFGPISFDLAQTPVGDVLVLWLRSFLLSYISFCLLLFFEVPLENSKSTVSDKVQDAKGISSVTDTVDEKSQQPNKELQTADAETKLSIENDSFSQSNSSKGSKIKSNNENESQDNDKPQQIHND